MGCNCNNKRKNLNYIRNLATKLAKHTNRNIQIYKELVGKDIFYNFEFTNNKKRDIIEIIKP